MWLSDERKRQICGAFLQGQGIRAIAEFYAVKRDTVETVIRDGFGQMTVLAVKERDAHE